MYQSIRNLYTNYYPFSGESCKNKAIYFLGIMLMLYLPGILCLSFYGTEYLFYLLSFFFLYFIYSELFFIVKSHESQKFRKEFCRILSNIRHLYYSCFSVSESVHYAAEGLRGESQRHLDRLYEILCSEDRKSGQEKYRKLVNDRFYRMFLMQAAAIEEHGDEEAAGSSVFLWSLGHLRKEAELEYRNVKRMEYLLTGLGMVIGVPVFLMPVIRKWALENLPELSVFYDGAAGRGMELAVYVLTFGMYCFLKELKGERYRPVFLKIIQKLTRMEMLRKFAAEYVRRHPQEEKRRELLKRTGDQRNAEEFFLYRLWTAGAFQILFLAVYFLFGRFQEIAAAVWILPALLMPVLGYWFPVLRLQISKGLLLDRMEEEVLNFQFLIQMGIKLPGITTLELLEELRENAVIFRDSLQCCIRDYGKDEQEAFLVLWKKEEYPPFRRLVDMFLMADESGIAEAFDEIEADMEEYQENRKLEIEILQQRKAEAAMLLAGVPGMVLLFGYLIIPFMLECFRMLERYNSSIAAL